MNLKVLLPNQVLVDEKVDAITAEAPDGTFTLLPGHIDFTSALVPGILSFRAAQDGPANQQEHFVAVNSGILVKKGTQVLVSTRHGVRSPELEKLRQTIITKFKQLDQRERKVRTVLARLESNFIERFIELD